MDDAQTLPYIMQSRYLIGQTPYIIERQLISRILRQFGIIQHMPTGVTIYARRYKDRRDWGPSLSFEIACAEFLATPRVAYDLRLHILDPGVTTDYAQYMLAHPFPQITDPGDPPPSSGDEEDDSDDPIIRR